MAMPPGQYSGQEQPSDSWRLMLAVALMAGLWMLWPIIFPAPPQAPEKPGAGNKVAAAENTPDATKQAQAVSAGLAHQQAQMGSATTGHLAQADASSGEQVHLPPPKPAEKFIELDSKNAHIILSSWGASVRRDGATVNQPGGDRALTHGRARRADQAAGFRP